MNRLRKIPRAAIALLAVVAALAVIAACGGGQKKAGVAAATDLKALMLARGLTEEDVSAALKTFTPTGKKDEFYLFASGGHGGNMIVIGVPSMRILKYIGVFTPEPWQGYGYDQETRDILEAGSPPGHMLTWGDMHHPAFSETNADYDGQFIFAND